MIFMGQYKSGEFDPKQRHLVYMHGFFRSPGDPRSIPGVFDFRGVIEYCRPGDLLTAEVTQSTQQVDHE